MARAAFSTRRSSVTATGTMTTAMTIRRSVMSVSSSGHVLQGTVRYGPPDGRSIALDGTGTCQQRIGA